MFKNMEIRVIKHGPIEKYEKKVATMLTPNEHEKLNGILSIYMEQMKDKLREEMKEDVLLFEGSVRSTRVNGFNVDQDRYYDGRFYKTEKYQFHYWRTTIRQAGNGQNTGVTVFEIVQDLSHPDLPTQSSWYYETTQLWLKDNEHLFDKEELVLLKLKYL